MEENLATVIKRLAKPDFERLKTAINVFVAGEGFHVPVRKIKTKANYINPDDIVHDEEIGTTILSVSNMDVSCVVEQEAFTKLFINKKYRIILSSLDRNGRDLFFWLLYELEAGKDYIWINYPRYMGEYRIKSINTYKEGVRNLIDKGIIAATTVEHTYWINPNMFFNGSRVKKYKDYLKLITNKEN